MLEKLRKRAEAGLSNKAEEIPTTALSEAVSDMEEIVNLKELESPFKIDIAYYRLLLILDAHITEEDTKLYESALRQLKKAATPNTETGVKTYSFVATGKRESDFECL